MTNAVATIGLTYRGVDIQEAFGNSSAIFLELISGLNETPIVRGNDVIVPQRAGRIQGTRIRDMLQIELRGIVMGATGATELTSYRTKVAAFRALFDPTKSGNLVATLEDASTVVLGHTRSVNTIWDQTNPGFARVSVQLESTDDWVAGSAPAATGTVIATGAGTATVVGSGSTSAVIVTVSNTQEALWLSSLGNMNIDVIELTSGTYNWSNGIVSVDRTARPLTIRPALGATVNFSRPAAGSAVFAIGYGGTCKYVTFDGRPGGVGTTSGMFCKDTTIAKNGFFEVYTTDRVTFKYLTFQNNAAGTYGGNTGGPTTTWCFYIGLGGTTSTYMTIDHCWFKQPAVTRGMGVAQVYAGGGGAAVTNFSMTNVMELTNYSVAFVAYGSNATNILLDTWTMSGVNSYYSDCGGGTASILFYGGGICSGTYSNITATTSDLLRDCHSGGGVVANGGGNSGI